MIGTREVRRSSRHTSKPEPSGSITSSSTRSKALRPASARASPAVRATSVSNPSRVSASDNGAVIDSSSSTRRTVRRPGCMEKACPSAASQSAPSRPRRGRIRTRSRRRGRRRGHSISEPLDPEPESPSSWPLRPEPDPSRRSRRRGRGRRPRPELSSPVAPACPVQRGSAACSASSHGPEMSSPASVVVRSTVVTASLVARSSVVVASSVDAAASGA